MQPALDFLDGHELVVYHTTWCPDCKRLERWLEGQGLTPGQVNIEEDDVAAATAEATSDDTELPVSVAVGPPLGLRVTA